MEAQTTSELQNKPRFGNLTKGQINQIASHYANEMQVPEEENAIRFHLYIINYHVSNGGNKNDGVLNDNWKALERLGITPDYLFKKSAAKKAKKAQKQELKMAKKAVKVEKKKAKVNIKNARAANIQSKADSRLALADQGINMTSTGGDILAKATDTIQAITTGETPAQTALKAQELQAATTPVYNQQSTPAIQEAQQSGGGNVAFPQQQTSGGGGGYYEESEESEESPARVASARDNGGNSGGGSKGIIFVIAGVLVLGLIIFISRKK